MFVWNYQATKPNQFGFVVSEFPELTILYNR